MTRPSPILSVALAVLALLATLLAAPPVGAVEDVTPARVAGGERTATAAEIALEAFPQGTDQAVLATSGTAQDALAAAGLAGAQGAAVLLVEPTRVPEATAAALDELGVEQITIVGDESDVSAEVEDGLGESRQVTRIAGDDPYETAALVAAAVAAEGGLEEVDGLRTVLLADGESFPDALAATPAAFAGPLPVLYTPTDQLGPDAAQALEDLDAEQVVVLGGHVAVSEAVADAIEDGGRDVVRLGGPDRVQTAITVADWTVETFGFGQDAILLARGDDFPDALTAGQLAGRFDRPLLLSATPTVLPDVAEEWFRQRCDVIEVVQAIGGEVAVSQAVLEQAETAAEACEAGGEPPAPGEGAPDYAVSPLDQQAELLAVDDVVASGVSGVASIDVVLFPCAAVEVDGDGSTVFTDDDGDGEADDYGTTNTRSTVITGVNGGDVDDATTAPAVAPDGDQLSAQVSAFAADCAAVVFIPAQGENVLPVDAAGRATVPYGVGVVTFGEGADPDPGPTPDPSPDPDRPASNVYDMSPDQPLSTTVGQAAQVTVEGRFDGAAIQGQLDIILFPCGNTQVLSDGPDTFRDADGDGGADGFPPGGSDAGTARITAINGQAVTPAQSVLAPAVNGRITVQVRSDAGADCATVVTVDGDGNGKFDVDAQGVPTEGYGVTQVRFTS